MNFNTFCHVEIHVKDLAAARDNLQFGHLRVAVSRAYYAMFYAATALLGSQGLWRSKHQGLIAAFGEHFETGLDRTQIRAYPTRCL